MKFSGTRDYVATEDLTVAVNAAVTLERPLLVKGEPGTGKTELARQVADKVIAGLEIQADHSGLSELAADLYWRIFSRLYPARVPASESVADSRLRTELSLSPAISGSASALTALYLFRNTGEAQIPGIPPFELTGSSSGTLCTILTFIFGLP